ncbi:NAD(P)H-dependent oxidoreductase [Paraburkholderia solitsugae]|uniref:NAD(P)H-dependent oxidoreductase n=1 Tax=Paraburkholderia solitsugae TaxID=2675748 RepID=UPI0022A815BE|nr:NAD(P)H-dependent oxidoreductase [Paraburkholderia solitsugae]
MQARLPGFAKEVGNHKLTYVFTDDGQTAGQLARQKVLFITTRGADLRAGSPYSSMDALTPALKAAFGFLGVADPSFVDAQPLQFSDEAARIEALERARTELTAVAANWAASVKSASALDIHARQAVSV